MEVKEPADGQWGRQMENGSWTGVVRHHSYSHSIITNYNNPDVILMLFLTALSSTVTTQRTDNLYVGGNGG